MIKNLLWNKWFSFIVAVVFLVTVATIGFLTIGAPIVIIVGGSGTVALILWLRFTFNKLAQPSVILPPYLLTCAMLMAHINEEFYMNFPEKISQLFHVDFTLTSFIAVFMLVGPVIYFLTALGLYFRYPLAQYIAWFILIGPGVAEFSHYIFPIIAEEQGITNHYAYFPGMYTAYLPMIPGIWGIIRVIRASRNSVQSQ